MPNFKIFRSRLAATSAIALAIASAPTGANAQQAESAGLDEIVVTAQKRAENLQDVAATITAFSSETLETRQIDGVEDLQTQIPSLVVNRYFGTSVIALRGISTGVTSGAEDPSIATHINGIYQPRSRSVDAAMADLERIEVLSGPQGTLYGRNATGGVINYILKGPTETFEGQVTGRVGNYDSYGAEARISGPISDNVGFLLSGTYFDQSKGYTRNLAAAAPKKSVEGGRSYGVRGALAFKLGENARLDLEAIYQNTRSEPYSAAFEPSLDPRLTPQSFVAHRTYTDLAGRSNSDYFQADATFTLDLSDDVTFKSITGYQTFKDKMLIDLDASAQRFITTTQDIDSKTFTQEFNLTASSFDNKLQSIFGVFYFNDTFTGASFTNFDIAGPGFFFQTFTKQKSESYAFFTDQTFEVVNGLRLIAGIRYNHDSKRAAQSLTTPVPALNYPLTTKSRSFSAWTPKFGFQFDVTDDVMIYGQWTKGFKSGGFVSNSAGDDFAPERIKGPEVGLKSTLFDNRVRFNLAGFYYDYSDLQVQKVVGVGTFLVENAAEARIYGVEASLNALITDTLQLDVSGLVQSAKYTNFLNCDQSAFAGACSGSDPRPDDESRLTDVSGNWLNRAPPYTLNVGLENRFDLSGGGKIVVRGETFFSGRVFFDEFARDAGRQKAYSIQNAYVTFTPASDSFTLRAFVKNIANKDYKVFGIYQSAATQYQGTWGIPRTFGAEATFRF